jgi:ABC-type multidrug transport system fused ATPase/permease subunit
MALCPSRLSSNCPTAQRNITKFDSAEKHYPPMNPGGAEAGLFFSMVPSGVAFSQLFQATIHAFIVISANIESSWQPPLYSRISRDCWIYISRFLRHSTVIFGSIRSRNSLACDLIATMLWTIAVILLILWLLGFSFHVAGAFVHILLVIALVVVVIRLVTGQAFKLLSFSAASRA